MNLFVTIDGVDGAGKTTVAELLSADGEFQYYSCPGGPFSELRKEVDLRAAPLERYCFYRFANESDSERIVRLLANGPVVSDRYVASTAAYHIAMDPRIRIIHHEAGLLKPHFAFLLTASAEVRNRRLIERGKSRSDKKLEEDSDFLDRVVEVFLSLPLIHVDTSDRTAEEVVLEIKSIVARGKSHGR